MRGAKEPSPQHPVSSSDLLLAQESLRRCDEHLLKAGKLALRSGQFYQGTAHLILAAEELATAVGYYRAATRVGPDRLPHAAPSTVAASPSTLLRHVPEVTDLSEVVREAAFLELQIDEQERGETARREFAADPIAWSTHRGRHAATLQTAFEQWVALAPTAGGIALPLGHSAGMPGDEQSFYQLWGSVHALAKGFRETLKRATRHQPIAHADDGFTVDWLSPPK
jgi:hypothetical protein